MIRNNFIPGLQQVNPNFFGLPNIPLNAGLQQLQDHCRAAYPNTVPLCFHPLKSFIKECGSEPLDYIYVYKSEGDLAQGIPRHWHYVGFGLSDIYGYGMLTYLDKVCRENSPANVDYAEKTSALQQLYPPYLPTSKERLSGFGIELTFRIKCNSEEDWNSEPPQWPGKVMQLMAKYVFKSKNVFGVGDHTAWDCSLDGGESRIRHMLMTLDPQLNEVETWLGRVKFIQLVGVCQEELQAAQQWIARGVLDLMSEREETGGKFLVTDMTRGQTIFELDPTNMNLVEEGIADKGSEMTSFSARHAYSSSLPKWFKEAENPSNDHDEIITMDHEPLHDLCPTTYTQGVERGNFLTMSREDTHLSQNYQSTCIRNQSRASSDSESALLVENADLVDTRFYDNLYLLLNYESAKLLPVILTGRLAHKRPFTYKSYKGDLWTTLVPDHCAIESLVGEECRFARRGPWLQIYVCERLRKQMLETLEFDLRGEPESDSTQEDTQPIRLPRNYSWPEFKLHITVVEQIEDPSENS